MNRFFLPGIHEGEEARICGDDAKHIGKVLRMAVGDELMLCDGEEYEYTARIRAITKDEVLVDVLSSKRCKSEPEHHITLFQGLPKSGKLELIIQKCVELGIYSVVPVLMDRSVVRISAQEFASRRERYQRVAYEAAKQCGRGRIPEIGGLLTPDALPLDAFELVLMPYELEHALSLKQALNSAHCSKNIAVIIGPEGGIADDEAEQLALRGAKAVTLGNRILRTETAGLAALAMILYELEG